MKRGDRRTRRRALHPPRRRRPKVEYRIEQIRDASGERDAGCKPIARQRFTAANPFTPVIGSFSPRRYWLEFATRLPPIVNCRIAADRFASCQPWHARNMAARRYLDLAVLFIRMIRAAQCQRRIEAST